MLMVFDAAYQKKRDTNVISRYHQNIRSYVGIIQIRYMGRSSELPLSLSNKLPVSFTRFSIVRLRKNVNINIKIYPVIFWSLIFWSQMQVSRTNCILQECFREAVICFCNAEYGKMHKKTEHTLKNHVNVPKLREVH